MANLLGGPSVDLLTGTELADELRGLDGNDALQGLGGDDVLDGGPGADVLDGGNGFDTVSYRNSPTGLQIFVSPGGTPTGEAAGDTFISIEQVLGTNFADYISGSGANLTMRGGNGNDTMVNSLGPMAGVTTFLFGENGEDTLVGGLGIDIMDGGADENTVSYLLAAEGLTISLANPGQNTGWARGDSYVRLSNVIGSDFNDTIYGNNGDRGPGLTLLNQLQGQSGDDVIYGGSAYNVLIGGVGRDQLHAGGTGNLIDYETAKTGLTASLANPGINTGDAEGDVYFRIAGSDLDLAGSPFRDTLFGDAGNNNLIGDPDMTDPNYGPGQADSLFGAEGNDTLDGGGAGDALNGGSGMDAASYNSAVSVGVRASLGNPGSNTGDAAGDTYAEVENLIGSRFNDVLEGDNAANSLFGQLGDDQLFGLGGDDILVGSEGADILDGGDGVDLADYSQSTSAIVVSLITGGIGGDFFRSIEGVIGSSFNDQLSGDAAANRFFGGAGDDILRGNSGDDLFDGGDAAGADAFFGDDGFDALIYAGATAGVIATMGGVGGGAAAGDTINGIENLIGSNFADRLTGDAGAANILQGGGGDDVLDGLDGYDVLLGGDGADTLYGGASSDDLTGGAGADTFAYRAFSESIRNPQNAGDLITDFQSGVDRIDLSALAATSLTITPGVETLVTASNAQGSLTIRVQGAVAASDVLLSAPPLTIEGTPQPDILNGGNGNDLIIGRGGADQISTGGGFDTVRYLSVSDSLPSAPDRISDFQPGVDKVDLQPINPIEVSLLRSGSDSVVFVNAPTGSMRIDFAGALNGQDFLTTGAGIFVIGDNSSEVLIGSRLAEPMLGNGGNDVMIGGAAGDVLFGGEGRDIFRFNAIEDTNTQGPDLLADFATGVDAIDVTALNTIETSIIRSGGGSFIFFSTPTGAGQISSIYDVNAFDIVSNQGPGVFMIGDATANLLIGSNRNDVFLGGDGDDIIVGGGSNDGLFGMGGADTFRFLAVSDSTGSALDSIFDFVSGVDKIDLRALGITAARVSTLASSGATFVFVDADGNGTGDMTILLTTTPSININTDILFS